MLTSAGKKRTRKAASSRVLALFPFVRKHRRDELWEFENLFVYGLQEMLGLLGKVSVLDLYPFSLGTREAPQLTRADFDEIRDTLADSQASTALTGVVDADIDPENLRIDRIRITADLVVISGTKVERQSFPFVVENAAPAEDSGRFAVSMADVLKVHREAFRAIKSALGWRFCAGADRRAYFEYRLRHPLTRSYDAYRHFVRARRMTQNREEKLVHYRRSLRYDPCIGQAYRNIGYLYKEAKRLRTAVEYYRRAVENLIDPDTLADAHAELGLCAANLNDVDEAIRHWQISRRWNPRNKDVCANLAIGYEEKGLVDKAIRFFNRAQQLDPQYYWACRGLGRIYAGRREWKKAIKQISLQLRIAPEDAWAHYTLGNCYFHDGHPEKARDHFRRAVELDPHGDAGRRAFQLLMEIDG